MAAATDYCFATKFAAIKLSELAIGIGPFVVGPAVERKLGKSAFSSMTINATKWFDASWALEKGLYTELFDSTQDMDVEISKLSTTLSLCSSESMKSLKKIMWEDTDHWEKLLMKRAEISGKLVLSDFTRKTISKFKENK